MESDGTDLTAALRRMGLVGRGESPDFQVLEGGVSSDIRRIRTARGTICIKRALPRLKVSADWRAPVERNGYEAEWLRAANRVLPGMAPEPLGRDPEAGVLAMDYLSPADHPVWKAELAAGRADADFAREVGRRLACVHDAYRDDPTCAEAFATDSIFRAIRLEPYLLATAAAHPELADVLTELARRTAETRETLVHGDVSPKNILAGPDGPVFIDAECAWYGDPAFDLAFCLNHLLLKCIWIPAHGSDFLRCFAALLEGYAPAEPVAERTAGLLPGLLLARIDGKSPVEYLTAESDRAKVRTEATRLLRDGNRTLEGIADAWRGFLGDGWIR